MARRVGRKEKRAGVTKGRQRRLKLTQVDKDTFLSPPHMGKK
jgi:hypothetical protein